MAFSQAAYQRLLEEIFLRFPSVQKSSFQDAYKPGLDGMRRFAEALGHPEEQFRSIHVAGTNGKGSVASMLASVLAGASKKTGLYTSPHLLDFRERARIVSDSSCTLIPEEYVFEFLSEWKPRFDELDLSFFEITTGLAFKYFADEKVDWAVIETGLGGRLDSTNILSPELTVITSIGLDHCAILGDTLEEIAAEKAGIFKPGVPALVGESSAETDPVFEDKAWMNCPLSYADKLTPSLWFSHGTILNKMDLKGEYQKNNLRTVLAAVDILGERSDLRALRDKDTVVSSIVSTAGRTALRGRWEKLSEHPTVIADIGHNAPALKYNFSQLEKLLSDGIFGSLIIVYGIMKDKDLVSILPLMPADATYIFVAPEIERALPADSILLAYKAYCASVGRSGVRAYSAPSVREGVQMAISLAQNLSQDSPRVDSSRSAGPLIYVGGSTFVVTEALKIFR